MAPAIQRASTATGICSIDEYFAGKDPFSICSTGRLPTPCPHGSGPLSRRGREVDTGLGDQYYEILKSHGIHFSSIAFRSSWRKSLRHEALDCLYIYVGGSDADTSNWAAAATEILEIFVQAGLKPSEISVEIASSTRSHLDFVSECLPDDEKLLGAIREIEPRVLELVRNELPDIWTSIAYHMRGPKYRREEQPLQPTVLVICRPDTRCNFEEIEASIAAVLDSEQYPQIALHLELIPGIVGLGMPNSRVLRSLKDQPTPRNSASIGVRGEQLDSGTLGGWLTFTPANDPSAPLLKCALTCYNVVAEGDIENQLHNDRNGINLNGHPSSPRIEVVFPANLDATRTRTWLRKEIRRGEIRGPSRQGIIDVLDTIEKAGPIGHVKYASKFRLNQLDRRMDWALVVSPETFTRNETTSDPFRGLRLRNPRDFYSSDLDDSIARFGTMKEGDHVAGCGRARPTAGEVNRIRRRVNWEDGGESYETEVIGFQYDFAYGGDEGAWVINMEKELVGIITGGEVMSSLYGCGFVTPIEDILEDVRKMAGGELSLP